MGVSFCVYVTDWWVATKCMKKKKPADNKTNNCNNVNYTYISYRNLINTRNRNLIFQIGHKHESDYLYKITCLHIIHRTLVSNE